MRRPAGWAWSPRFDVNSWPNLQPVESTPITPGGPRTGRSVDELVEASESFGLTEGEAVAIVAQVELHTRDWVDVADHYGIEAPAEGRLESAFEHENRSTARRWADRLRTDVATKATSTNERQSGGWVRPHLRNGRPVAGYHRDRRG